MTTIEYYEDQDELPRNEGLQKAIPNYQESCETNSPTSTDFSARDHREDPGLPVLLGLTCTTLRRDSDIDPSSRQSSMSEASNMADSQDEPPPTAEPPVMLDVVSVDAETDGHGLKVTADSAVDLSAKAIEPVDDLTDMGSHTRKLATRPRADSTPVEISTQKDDHLTHGGLESPLRIRTTETNTGAYLPHQKRDSISASPTLSKHVIPSADVHGQSLPPLQPPSPSSSSPKAERLPSIAQITNSLTELAEAATQEIPRQQQGLAHHHSQSFGSAMSHSPTLTSRAYPTSVQTSPQAYYPPPPSARSPTSTIGESTYASPPAYSPYGPYNHRRASMADGVPPIMPKLPTASSSGDSYGGYPSSGTEGYSTSHTTPIDISQAVEYAPRPMLPPPPGMHALQPPPPPIMVPGPYKCDVPNCTAGTFQTQYLLNSHKNVHSQSRPHYCPVVGCSRSEGGKGFKRKNEMIRHGLVHNSPGYVCPFCPEREHRYPRPDNLQRHVRVHHVDKDRDDDILRDVLNQRTEGQGKTRRRRTNTGVMVAAL